MNYNFFLKFKQYFIINAKYPKVSKNKIYVKKYDRDIRNTNLAYYRF
jgi:hypothetical protein